MKNPKSKTHDVDYYCTSASNLAIVYLLLQKPEIARQHALDAVKTAEAYILCKSEETNTNITNTNNTNTNVTNSATKKGTGTKKSKSASMTADSMKKVVDKVAAAAADVPHRTVSI